MYWIFAYFNFPQKPFYKMKYLPTYRIYLQIVLKVNHCSKICIHTQWQCTNRFYSKPLVVLEVDCKTNFTLLHSQTFDLRTMSTSKMVEIRNGFSNLYFIFSCRKSTYHFLRFILHFLLCIHVQKTFVIERVIFSSVSVICN